MTTIIATRKAMGSDTMVSNPDTGLYYPARKIVRVKGDLIGAAGDSGDCLRFMDWAKHDFSEKKKPKFTVTDGDQEAQVLILNAEGLFMMCPTDPYPEQIESEFWAIGSGADAALGALAMGATLEQALEVAARFDNFTKAPFRVEALKP